MYGLLSAFLRLAVITAEVSEPVVAAGATAGAAAVASSETAAPAAAPAPLRLELVNSGPHAIRALHACRAGAATWGPNLLTTTSLQPTQSVELGLPQGCGRYDLRLVADDDIEYLDEDVELCDAAVDAAAAGSGQARKALLVVGAGELSIRAAARPPAALETPGGRP